MARYTAGFTEAAAEARRRSLGSTAGRERRHHSGEHEDGGSSQRGPTHQ